MRRPDADGADARPAAWRGAQPLLAAALACAVCAGAHAGPVRDRVRAAGEVRVCIWPTYHGVTYRHPRTRQLSGIDIELSRHFAQDLGVRVVHVDSSVDAFVHDLLTQRCDVAMSGIGKLRPRMQDLRFSQPYLHSSVHAVTTKSNPVVRQWSDIDRPGVAVGVQSGSLLLPAIQARLRHATVVTVQPTEIRERELAAGRIDVFFTNDIYARQLTESADWTRVVLPPSPVLDIPLAYAVRPGDDEWLAAVDAFVARAKGDGRLLAAARRYGLGALVAP